MKTYYIEDDKFNYSFRLIICDTRKQMIKAKTKEDLREYGKIEHDITDEKTLGIFRATFSKIDQRAEGEFFSNVFGTMYLNIEDIKSYGDEIIYHECCHCTIVHETNVIRYIGNYDMVSHIEDNERFCYYLGKLICKVKAIVKNYRK